jgi:hypothetical protein
VDEAQHRVVIIVRVIRKINARHESFEQTSQEDRHYQMRSLWYSARPGNGPGFDGRKAEAPALIGSNAPVTFEAGLDCFILPVLWVGVFSMRICLPDFQDGVWNGQAVTVQYRSLKYDALTENSRGREFRTAASREANLEEGSDGL